MKVLLDTHVFLWMSDQFHNLSQRAAAVIQDSRNDLFLSHASLWEMQIKIHNGKLKFTLPGSDQAIPLSQKIAEERTVNQIQLLPITEDDIYALTQLPLLNHRDPFDRMLIVQAMRHQIPIISRDAQFSQYPVVILW